MTPLEIKGRLGGGESRCTPLGEWVPWSRLALWEGTVAVAAFRNGERG